MIYIDLLEKLKYKECLTYLDMKRLFYNELKPERRIDVYDTVHSIFELDGVYYKMMWRNDDKDFTFEYPYEVELIPASKNNLKAWVEK